MTYEETIDTIPAEADKAWNYEELRALWRQQRQRAETPPEELQTWDEAVLRLLKHNERTFYLDETTLAGVGAAGGKLNRLTKILLGRHARIDLARK